MLLQVKQAAATSGRHFQNATLSPAFGVYRCKFEQFRVELSLIGIIGKSWVVPDDCLGGRNSQVERRGIAATRTSVNQLVD